MNATSATAYSDAGKKSTSRARLNWRRALLATTAALSLGAQNAWAVCSDGTVMPNDGFVVGRDPQVLTAANWSANIFTAPAGSLFIPDNSVHEHNDPALQLYHWAGFSEVSRRPNYYPGTGGKAVVALVLRRDLF